MRMVIIVIRHHDFTKINLIFVHRIREERACDFFDIMFQHSLFVRLVWSWGIEGVAIFVGRINAALDATSDSRITLEVDYYINVFFACHQHAISYQDLERNFFILGSQIVCFSIVILLNLQCTNLFF